MLFVNWLTCALFATDSLPGFSSVKMIKMIIESVMTSVDETLISASRSCGRPDPPGCPL